jgi:hypothetical protein
MRRCLRQALNIQSITVSLSFAICNYFPSLAEDPIFMEILELIHINFLIIIETILSRLPPECQQNIWAHALIAILMRKKPDQKPKEETIDDLQINNLKLVALVKTISKKTK